MSSLEIHTRYKYLIVVAIKGEISKKLIIFDLDDTLIKTDARVKILDSKTGETLKELDNKGFANFVKKKGFVINFEDFESPELLRKGRIIKNIFGILKKAYLKKTHIAILTARSSSELVRNFFLEHGIDIHTDLVIAVGDNKFKSIDSIPEKKRDEIKNLIDQGYTDLVFFDDNEDNLRLAKRVEGYKGAKIKTIKVD